MNKRSILTAIGLCVGLLFMAVFPTEVAGMVQHLTHAGAHDVIIASPVVLASLANVNGSSEGKPNPGGTRKLFIIFARDVVGVWPKAGDIVDGQIINPPVLVAGKPGFAEYDFPDASFNLGDSQDGDPGYQSFKQMVGFNLAGFDKALVAEVGKHLNSGSIVVGELNDSQMAVAGSSDNPLYIKGGFSSGSKGNDKRGYTFKGEADGFMWGITPLKTEVATALTLVPKV